MQKLYTCLVILLAANFAFAQNQKTIDSLLRALNTNLADTQRIRVYNKLASQYLQTLDSAQITHYTSKAIEFSQQHAYSRGIINAKLLRGLLYMRKGVYSKAQGLFKNVLDIVRKNNDKKGQAKVLNNLTILSFKQGNQAQSIAYVKESLKLYKSMHSKIGMARSYSNLGTVYQYQAHYPQALAAYFKSLSLSKETGSKRGESYNYHNIAIIYETQNRLEKALAYYKKSLKIKQELGARLDLISTNRMLGGLYSTLNQPQKAESHHLKALNIAREIKSRTSTIECYTGLGDTYVRFKQYNQALNLLKKALKLEKSSENKLSFIGIYITLSRAYYHLKKYNKALGTLKKANNLSKQSPLSEDSRVIARIFAQIYEALGDYKQAYANHKLFKLLADSLLNKESTAKIARLESEFEFKKEKDSIQFVQAKKQAAFDAEINARHNKQQATYAGLVLVSILLLTMVFFFRDKQKSNRKLNQVNEALAQSNKEIKVAHEEVKITNEEINTMNEQLANTLQVVEEQHDDIISSINYAQRIQKALLPSQEEINEYFPDNFILYKPREIVSGDFYWFTSVEPHHPSNIWETNISEKYVLIAADCTGHGVPGAFMTILGAQALTDIVVQQGLTEPDQILNTLDKTVKELLRRKTTLMDDGMDITVVVIDKEAKTLKFAGAKNPLILIQDNKLTEVKGDIYSINGHRHQDEKIKYTAHTFDISVPTTFYIYSDGYQDQFGGKQGKKFMKKQLLKKIQNFSGLPLPKQKQMLEATLHNWMQADETGKNEQVDDILVMGVKLDL